jgi:hypothetical protein
VDDTELMAAIGRMVVNAGVLEYFVAELVAVIEGLRDEEARHDRAVEILRVTGKAMRLFERVAKQRPDLEWLMRDTKAMLGARHFVAHSVAQQDAIAEGRPALFVVQPRHGETMITTEQARDNARLIWEGIGRIQRAIDKEIAG